MMNNPVPPELKQVVDDLLAIGFKRDDAVQEAKQLNEWQNIGGNHASTNIK